ncbi:MauE/DoxX family redox-associated membrane protein [Thermopolyspora sp. NPDC052614]|uniref:MauE/DoxX family redox-associated membrane protein n=1 Tax=Thermopolyspora sp. NPDC052614 TaxID=3155682 RepID=UPI00341200C6
MMGYLMVGAMVVISTTFAAASLGKLRDLPGFRASLRGLVPGRTLALTAVLVPTAELITVAAFIATLVDRRASVIGFGLAAVLLAAFTVGVAVAIRKDGAARCHCFGRQGAVLSTRHVIRNVFLLGVALAGLAGRGAFGDVDPAGAAIAVICALWVAANVIFMDEIIALFGGP